MTTIDRRTLEIHGAADRVTGCCYELGDGVLIALLSVAGPDTLFVAPLVYSKMVEGTQVRFCNPESLHWENFLAHTKDPIRHVILHPGALPRTPTAKAWDKIIGAVRGRHLIRVYAR